MKIVVFNLGCKVNQYESGKIAGLLTQKGYEVSTCLKFADIYIINTCAVTNEAERKSRQAVNRVLKYNPQSKVVILGCASQANQTQFDNTNIVFIRGTADKYGVINELIDNNFNTAEQNSSVPKTYSIDTETQYIDNNCQTSVSDKRRCLIKIQDGCNNFCSYCIVPYLRGRSRSRKTQDIIAEINANKGKFKEFVLVGIDISSYGRDIDSSLPQLIDSLPQEITLHIGSLEVNAINQQLMDSLKNFQTFSRHFHLSLQSGCDSVLHRMNRKYTTSGYYDAVKLIRSNFPDAVITTDIIVGFPNESDEEFNQTVEFVKLVNFSKAHIFKYSPKQGTVAASMKQVDSAIVNKRLQILNELWK